MVTLTRVPISCFATRCSMASRAASKVMPLTMMGPSFGKLIRPSRSTVSS